MNSTARLRRPRMIAHPALHSPTVVRCRPFGDVALPLGRRVTIGRHPACDLVLANPLIARRQVSLELLPSSARLEDTGGGDLPVHVDGRRAVGVVRVARSFSIGPYRFDICPCDQVAPDPCCFEGTLGYGELATLLASIERSRRTGVLDLMVQGHAACITFEDGIPCQARHGAMRSETAILALLRDADEARFGLRLGKDAVGPRSVILEFSQLVAAV